MFEKILNVFRIDDLRKKIVTTLILLFVYRIGFQIPIPGISLERVHDVQKIIEKQGAEAAGPFGGFFTMVSTLSAGGLLSIGIFKAKHPELADTLNLMVEGEESPKAGA